MNMRKYRPLRGHGGDPLRGLLITTFVSSVVLLMTGGGGCSALEISFDDPTSGFFLRERSASSSSSGATQSGSRSGLNPAAPTTSIILGGNLNQGRGGESGESAGNNTIIHAASFTTLGQSQPATLRAQYGPFATSQTAPTQYLLPDFLKGKISVTDFGRKSSFVDLTAHLVTREIPKDKPILRVLFHAAAGKRSHNHHRGSHQRKRTTGKRRICVRVSAHFSPTESTSSVCSPDPRDGTCLGQTALPSSWWPSIIAVEDSKKSKQPKISVKVTYSVFEIKRDSLCDDIEEGNSAASSVQQLLPETALASSVPLTPPTHGYRQLGHDNLIHMLLPQAPVYPGSRLYVPVFVNSFVAVEEDFSAVTFRCRTRSGLRVAGIQTSPSMGTEWAVETDVNQRGTQATVTVYKGSANKHHTSGGGSSQGPKEIFSWLLAVDDREYDDWNQGKVSWHVSYEREQKRKDQDGDDGEEEDDVEEADEDALESHKNETRKKNFFEGQEKASSPGRKRWMEQYKIRTKIEVLKDDVQRVLPVAKRAHLVNVASLTGRQSSLPLKILIVSQAGKVADVTLHSSCVSGDESALKVSSSCASVYVDGSETRGAISARVEAKYGSLTGRTEFKVWKPETPLTTSLDDPRLSQIRGWKIEKLDEKQGDKMCANRYQQTRVRVYAQFVAEDPDSGRKDYFPSRGAELDVTSLVKMRLEDNSVAVLRGDQIEGQSPGRTELQVVSPISGQIIGRQEVKVTKNKENIVSMEVNVLTGIHLDISAEGEKGVYAAKVSYSEDFAAKYQEGILDVTLGFSDDTEMHLRDVNPNDFKVEVASLNQRVIDYAPKSDSRWPRVIAVGGGNGKLLKVELRIPTNPESTGACAVGSGEYALAKASADVSVAIPKEKSVDMGDLGDDIAMRDQQQQQQQHRSYSSARKVSMPNTDYPTQSFSAPNQFPRNTPLEIGMYVLLGVFCAAIAVFVASCFVYASKFKGGSGAGQEFPLQNKSQSVQNAHDWVWLGKSTIDKASSNGNATFESTRDLTTSSSNSTERKSQRLSYVGSEINIIPNPQTEEYEAEVSSPEESRPMLRRSAAPLASSGLCPELPRRGVRRKLPATPRQPPLQMVNGKPVHRAGFAPNRVPLGPTRLPPAYKRPEQNSSRRSLLEPTKEETLVLPDEHQAASEPTMSFERRRIINTNTFTKSPSARPKTLSPLESQLASPPGSAVTGSPVQLRQSPASALPPLEHEHHPETYDSPLQQMESSAVEFEQSEEDDEFLQNPALDLPSPPRLGAPLPRVFPNPFEVCDDESRPIEPEKTLSPNHIFEAKNDDTEDSIEAIFEKASQALEEKKQKLKEEEEEEDNLTVGMDYEQLMSYFECLKESNA